MNPDIIPTELNLSMLDHLAEVWGSPWLPDFLHIRFSARLRKSLGRCRPATGEIHLNADLQGPDHAKLLSEVLCHEAAHVVAYSRHGKNAKPHGQEWRKLVQDAGFLPRVSLGVVFEDCGIPPSRRKVLFEHRCPVCQAVWYARKSMLSWRCSLCTSQGLPGELEIIKHPIKSGDKV